MLTMSLQARNEEARLLKEKAEAAAKLKAEFLAQMVGNPLPPSRRADTHAYARHTFFARPYRSFPAAALLHPRLLARDLKSKSL